MSTGKSKKIAIGKLKKKCWDALSKAIRMEAADSNGIVECVTCNCKKPWKQMQAGHLIGGRTNGVLFDERGIFPQCVGCNMFKQGMGPEFTVFVIKNYGQGLVDELIQLRRTAVRFTRSELEEMLEGYQERINDYQANH